MYIVAGGPGPPDPRARGAPGGPAPTDKYINQ